MSPRRLGALGAATAGLLLAGTPAASGLELAPTAVATGPIALDTGAASKGRSLRRRCLARRKGRTGRLRRTGCARLRRLVAPPPTAERLLPVVPPRDAPRPGFEPPAGAPSPSPPSSPPSSLLRFVSVAAREWSLTLSRPVVGAGTVTMELYNAGEDPHNLIVSPDDDSHAPLGSWAETAPGDYVRQSLTLPAGRYLLWCSLEGHEAAGMSVRLRVE